MKPHCTDPQIDLQQSQFDYSSLEYKLGGFNAGFSHKFIMQLPDEKKPTSPVTNGTPPFSFPEYDPSSFGDNPFLSRTRHPPTFFQMLASLSDSPAAHPDCRVDTFSTASVSVDSTMDGRDTPVLSSVALLAPVSAEVTTGASDRPIVVRRRGLQRRKLFSLCNEMLELTNSFQFQGLSSPIPTYFPSPWWIQPFGLSPVWVLCLATRLFRGQ